jgi:hypothetical protein
MGILIRWLTNYLNELLIRSSLMLSLALEKRNYGHDKMPQSKQHLQLPIVCPGHLAAGDTTVARSNTEQLTVEARKLLQHLSMRDAKPKPVPNIESVALTRSTRRPSEQTTGQAIEQITKHLSERPSEPVKN